MWVKADDGTAFNLDNCAWAEPSTGTPGVATFHLTATSGSSSGISVPVTFGTTTEEAAAGIAKVTQAVDPAIYE